MDEAQKPQGSETPAPAQPQSGAAGPAPAAAPASTPPAKKNGGFLKKKGVIIALVVLLLLGIVGGVFGFVSSRTASLQQEEEAVDTSVVETLSPEELGLTITAKPDKKAIKFKVEKASDIKTIEYQVTYEADSTAQEKAEGGEDRVQRGITGEAEVSGASYESEWLDLGSCSRNVCKYDTGVETVEITLKVVKKSGKTYEVQQSHEL